MNYQKITKRSKTLDQNYSETVTIRMIKKYQKKERKKIIGNLDINIIA